MSMIVNVHKQLGDFKLQVEFNLEHGVLGLLGASGSGKSKTLQCIAGIEKTDEGRIVINNKVLFDSKNKVNLSTQQRRVGYLFQNYALFPNMTVVQNIACGVHHISDKLRRKQIIAEMIDKMRLTGLEQQKPLQLSGGQQQRVALARILINEPDILLLDEPFSALDSYLKEQLMAELTSLLKQFQKDVIIVTHSREEAYQLCDYIAILEQGHLDAFDHTKKIFDDPKTRTGAELTGCKNIVEARKADATHVYVPSWGITFDTGRPVRDGLGAIGIRAYYFYGGLAVNSFPIQIVEKIEQPFEWIIKFRYSSQHEDTRLVWWRFAKHEMPIEMPDKLGVEGKDILLLYM